MFGVTLKQSGVYMTSIFRLILFTASLFAGKIAHAQFETVQIPEGLDFECDQEGTVEECKEELASEIYWNEYGDFRKEWEDKLLLGVDHFFSQELPSGAIDEDFATPHLIDAQYIRTYRWEYWAFAIDDGCEARKRNCKPILRMLSARADDDINDQKMKNKDFYFPKTPESLAKFFAEVYAWQEVDLQRCKGAVDHIAKFPAQDKKVNFWHPHYLSELKGHEVHENVDEDEDQLIVSTHGATMTLRASGQKDPLDPYMNDVGRYAVYQHGYYYEGYKWAEEMKDIVEPCLKPSTATPPWEKVLAHQAKNE